MLGWWVTFCLFLIIRRDGEKYLYRYYFISLLFVLGVGQAMADTLRTQMGTKQTAWMRLWFQWTTRRLGKSRTTRFSTRWVTIGLNNVTVVVVPCFLSSNKVTVQEWCHLF